MKKRMDDIHSVNQENKIWCINQNMAIVNAYKHMAITIMQNNPSSNQLNQWDVEIRKHAILNPKIIMEFASQIQSIMIYKMPIQNNDIQNAYHGMIYKMPIQKRP